MSVKGGNNKNNNLRSVWWQPKIFYHKSELLLEKKQVINQTGCSIKLQVNLRPTKYLALWWPL